MGGPSKIERVSHLLNSMTVKYIFDALNRIVIDYLFKPKFWLIIILKF